MTITLTTDNCFATEVEAIAQAELMLGVTGWTNPLSADHKKALIMATEKINNLNFQYKKYDAAQTLEFPRYLPKVSSSGSGVIINEIIYESKTPDDIKKATVYEAVAILENMNSAHLKNQALGIKSISFQGDSVTYDGSSMNGLLSKEAYKLVSKWTGAAKVV